MKGIIMKLNFYIIISIISLSSATFFLFFMTTSQKTGVKNSYNIAILIPAEHPSLQKIETGFKETFQKNSPLPVQFDSFNAHGDRVLLGTHARNIALKNYDLVFTIGAQASQLISEQIKKRKKQLPHVFAAVSNPVGLGLIQSLEKPGTCTTGVYEDPYHQKIVDATLALKPSIKTVLLVYNPTQGAGLEQQQEQLKKLFAEHGITLRPCPVFNAQEIPTKVGALIGSASAVLILKDNTVVPAVSALIKICNQYQIPLITSELESNEKGAALSIGVHEEAFGIEGALLTLKIMREQKNPALLACVTAGSPETRINEAALQNQGITLTKEQRDIFTHNNQI